MCDGIIPFQKAIHMSTLLAYPNVRTQRARRVKNGVNKGHWVMCAFGAKTIKGVRSITNAWPIKTTIIGASQQITMDVINLGVTKYANVGRFTATMRSHARLKKPGGTVIAMRRKREGARRHAKCVPSHAWHVCWQAARPVLPIVPALIPLSLLAERTRK